MPRKAGKPSRKPSKRITSGTALARVVAMAMYDYHLMEDNGKHGLVGIFDTLGAAQFPARFAFYLFVKISGAPGHHVARIELGEIASQRPSFQLPVYEFRLPDQPVAYSDLVTQVSLDFPGPGVHEWRVYLDGMLSGLYTFRVVAGS